MRGNLSETRFGTYLVKSLVWMAAGSENFPQPGFLCLPAGEGPGKIGFCVGLNVDASSFTS